MYIYIRLNAGHDRNGNAQRVFVVMNEFGDIVDALDEGCHGTGELTKKYPKILGGCEFKTTKREYKDTLKFGEEQARRLAERTVDPVLSQNQNVTLEMTLDQAKRLGVVFCQTCGHPPNNHFDHDKKPCAHCSDCKEYRQTIRLPRSVVR